MLHHGSPRLVVEDLRSYHLQLAQSIVMLLTDVEYITLTYASYRHKPAMMTIIIVHNTCDTACLILEWDGSCLYTLAALGRQVLICCPFGCLDWQSLSTEPSEPWQGHPPFLLV